MTALRLIATGICLAWVWMGTAGDATAKKRKRRRRPAMHRTTTTNASLLTPSYSAPPEPIAASEPPTTVEAEAVLGEPSDNLVAASLILQGDIKYGPAAIGFAGEYRRRLSERWSLAAGVGLALRQHRALLEPHVGADLTFLSVSSVDFHASLGVAAPLQFMTNTRAVAVAGRGGIGVQWGLLDWLRPHAGVVIVAGPLLTPTHLRGSPYVALQVMVGSTFAL